MPEFTPSDLELWFSIMDRSFQTTGIVVDATKFGYALTAIGARYALEVRDIIMSPPAENAYNTLRTELVKRISLSQEHKTRQLLEHEEIGDRKPSQFLRHLRSFAGNVVGDGVLRTIWLSRLPVHVQPHLVTRTTETLDQLAETADAIAEATKAPANRISEVTHPNPNEAYTQVQTQQRELLEQIATLQKTIETMKISDRSRDSVRRGQQYRTRSTSRGRPSTSVCWYHYRFGQAARKCQPPCSIKGTGNETTPQ